MKIDGKSILTTAAVMGALSSFVFGAWAFGDKTGYRPWLKLEQDSFVANDLKLVMEQTEQNTLAMAKLQFDILWGKKQFGGLNFEEKVSLCKTAQILGYNLRASDGSPECTADGEPVFTFQSK